MTRTLVMVNSAGSAAPSRREKTAAEPRASARRNLLGFAVLATPLVGATVLSKFTGPPLGAEGVDISLLFRLPALFVGAIGGCLRVELRPWTPDVPLIGIQRL